MSVWVSLYTHQAGCVSVYVPVCLCGLATKPRTLTRRGVSNLSTYASPIRDSLTPIPQLRQSFTFSHFQPLFFPFFLAKKTVLISYSVPWKSSNDFAPPFFINFFSNSLFWFLSWRFFRLCACHFFPACHTGPSAATLAYIPNCRQQWQDIQYGDGALVTLMKKIRN